MMDVLRKSDSIKPKYHCSFGNQQTYSAWISFDSSKCLNNSLMRGKILEFYFLIRSMHRCLSVHSLTKLRAVSPCPSPGQNHLQITFLPLILPCRNSQALSVDNDPWTNQSHVSFLYILRPKNAFCILKWVKRSSKDCAIVMHTN